MKILGIIVEYNPFHTGHLYHLQKAKQEAEADFCVAGKARFNNCYYVW